MGIKYKKFTPEDKESYVKEYLRLKKQTGISKLKYSKTHEIPATTFKRWVKQYVEFVNENAVVPAENNNSAFIMISEEDDKVITEKQVYDPDRNNESIRLIYKDAVLEFQSGQLREVMEILRLW